MSSDTKESRLCAWIAFAVGATYFLLPLIATFELNQILARPRDKALFWQDLLLAKSVLQNI